ncbi:CapA family protein [Kribbella sp. DT2]|uniref:CapA family protein n=1 Tax=Kribbella sp. DT2 TaxID=3393427 RepID=UPI003CE6A9B1
MRGWRVVVLGLLLAVVGGCADVPGTADVAPTDSGSGPGVQPPHGVQEIILVATGDVLLHERLWTTARQDGRNGQWDFAPLLSGVKPLVQNADLAVCHLETPIGTPYSGYPLFQGPPQIAPALKRTGYDVCSTASNHSFDQGAAGIDRTLRTLDPARIETMARAARDAGAQIVVVSCH